MGDDIFGGTGNVGHLFVYDTITGQSTDLGEALPGLSSVPSLLATPQRVYGLAGSVYLDAHLFAFDPADPTLVSDLGIPVPTSTDLGSLVLANGKLYGAARDMAVVFAYDVGLGTFQTWDVSGAGISGVDSLVAAPDGLLYGGGYAGYGNGRLFAFNPVTGLAQDLGTPVPGDTSIGAVLVGPDGRLYGGTSLLSGHLFGYDIGQGMFETFGAPVWRDTALNALIVGSDGLIYGGTGWQHGRLFRFDPGSYPPAPWAGTATSLAITPPLERKTSVPLTTEVWAMTTAADGRVYISGYGPTVLSRWDPAGGTMESLGQVPGGASVVHALVEGADGTIYGGGGSYGGVAVFFGYDPANAEFTYLPLGIPGEDVVYALTRCPSGLIYGSTGGLYSGQHGHVFAYNPQTGAVVDHGQVIAGEDAVLSLACSADGSLYGGTRPNGYLFRLDPAEVAPSDVIVPLPGESAVWALAWAPDGRLYGGTAPNGLIFAYDPPANEATLVGRPITQDTAVYDLAAGADGLLYGVTGGLEGHLIALDPATGALSDRGKPSLLDANAYSLSIGPGVGQVYVGTGYVAGDFAVYDTGYRFAWLNLEYGTALGEDTTLVVDVVDAAGTVLLAGVPSGGSLLDVSSLAWPAVQLRATLATSDTIQTPALLDWTVTWTQNPKLVLTPPALEFSAAPGQPDPLVRALAVTNESAGELPWSVSGLPAWLAVAPAAGVAPSGLVVTATVDGLPTGIYTATLRFDGPPDCVNCPRSLPVRLDIRPRYQIYLPLVGRQRQG